MNTPPTLPDGSEVSPSGSVFMIGKNRNGLWVAREETGCIGGIFLTERAATHFAERWARILGCSTACVSEPLEFDFDTDRSAFVSLCLALKRSVANLQQTAISDALRIVFGLAMVAIAVWLVLAFLTFGR